MHRKYPLVRFFQPASQTQKPTGRRRHLRQKAVGENIFFIGLYKTKKREGILLKLRVWRAFPCRITDIFSEEVFFIPTHPTKLRFAPLMVGLTTEIHFVESLYVDTPQIAL